MLMKVLSGRLTAKDRLTINGEIRYNGKLTNEFNVRRSASYVDQQDNHIADLTVRETLLFALQCLTVRLGLMHLAVPSKLFCETVMSWGCRFGL